MRIFSKKAGTTKFNKVAKRMDLPIYPTENEEKMDMEDHFLIEKKSRSTHGDFTMFVLQSFVWGSSTNADF